MQDKQLFLAIAEGLKQPLLQIARMAEWQAMQSAGDGVADDAAGTAGAAQTAAIRTTADMGLRLLDCYVLSLRLATADDSVLAVEPVSLSAVLYDTAEELRAIAASYGVVLQLHIQGRYEPVMANREALQSALLALGCAVIEALPATGGRQHVQLATHRSRTGIVAGMYGDFGALTPRSFERARQLQGLVRQPLPDSLPGSGAGLFIADNILAAMASRLRVGRFQKLPGFAMTLPASEQLQFV